MADVSLSDQLRFSPVTGIVISASGIIGITQESLIENMAASFTSGSVKVWSRKGREPRRAGMFRQDSRFLPSPLDAGPQRCPGRSCFPGCRPAGCPWDCWFSFPSCLLFPKYFFPALKHWNTSLLFPSISFHLLSVSVLILYICFLHFFLCLKLLIIWAVFPVISFLLYSPFPLWVYNLLFPISSPCILIFLFMS